MDRLADYIESNIERLPWSGCWIWMLAFGKKHGYGAAWNGKYARAHRLSYEVFNGAIPEGLSVLHRCDEKLCVNPAHLFVGTQLDNMRDMVAKGRINAAPVGNTRGAKITAEIVRAIRADTRTALEISAAYGIARPTVYGIKHRRSWKWA